MVIVMVGAVKVVVMTVAVAARMQLHVEGMSAAAVWVAVRALSLLEPRVGAALVG